MQDVFIEPSGQDDNLGDSILRVGLLRALRGEGRRLHLLLEGQSSDYLTVMPIDGDTIVYSERSAWSEKLRKARGAVFVLNAGEVNPNPWFPFPHPTRVAHASSVLGHGGAVIAAGLGFKDPASASRVAFDDSLRHAAVVSWRDASTRDAAGFGGVAPDWGFALGSDPSTWPSSDDRPLIAATLRFDRAWPDERWINGVRGLAVKTGTSIVTIAQVARDAPRAVHLAQALGGEYLVAPSTRHDDVDAHIRSIYSRSLAVVSDRAHALIIGATEGAYPIGSAANPEKIRRLLDAAGLGELTGDHDGLAERTDSLRSMRPRLPARVSSARQDLAALAERIRLTMSAVAGT